MDSQIQTWEEGYCFNLNSLSPFVSLSSPPFFLFPSLMGIREGGREKGIFFPLSRPLLSLSLSSSLPPSLPSSLLSCLLPSFPKSLSPPSLCPCIPSYLPPPFHSFPSFSFLSIAFSFLSCLPSFFTSFPISPLPVSVHPSLPPFCFPSHYFCCVHMGSDTSKVKTACCCL